MTSTYMISATTRPLDEELGRMLDELGDLNRSVVTAKSNRRIRKPMDVEQMWRHLKPITVRLTTGDEIDAWDYCTYQGTTYVWTTKNAATEAAVKNRFELYYIELPSSSVLSVEPRDRKPNEPVAIDMAKGPLACHPKPNVYKIIQRCPQMAVIHALRGDVSEPRWWAALRITEHCEPDLSRACSDGYPGFTDSELSERVARIHAEMKKPTRCAHFDDVSPNICTACRFSKQINSPMALGYEHEPKHIAVTP
jgi:hypothetical protein